MRKQIAIFLMLCMMVSMLPVTASAAVESGSCGQNITWNFDRGTGTLSISGSGVMQDYERSTLYNMGGQIIARPAPWNEFASEISNIVISPGITRIGSYAFKGCRIKAIAIPDSVSQIGMAAFAECQDLQHISIPFGIEIILSETFTNCTSLTSISIPSSVTRIVPAFRGCSSLVSISIPDGVTAIESGTFSGCSSLESVHIPDRVTKIEEGAFRDCSGLTSVYIPESVQLIGREAFKGCIRLRDVYYSGHKAQWGEIRIIDLNAELKSATVHYSKGTDPVLYTPFQKIAVYTHGQFVDVSSASWYTESVRSAYEYGLMNGVSDTSFNPDGNLNVISAITLACRIHSLYHKNNADFTSDGVWYEPYLEYAQVNNIIFEVREDAYHTPITRADFALLISNALPDAALQEINTIGAADIPDVSTGSDFMDAINALAGAGVVNADYAFDIYSMSMLFGENPGPGIFSLSPTFKAIYRLYRAGILIGNDKFGTFTPNANITRSAVAAIVSRVAEPALRQHISLVKKKPSNLVSLNQLKNLSSIRSQASNAQLAQAYEKAKKIVEPLANLSREAQLCGIATVLRIITDHDIEYSMSAPHYDDPYGFFNLHKASCAGCTRATGLCLNMLGIPYEHINEGQYTHQWTRVNVNGRYWICDAYGLYCGPEIVPYKHPNFS